MEKYSISKSAKKMRKYLRTAKGKAYLKSQKKIRADWRRNNKAQYNAQRKAAQDKVLQEAIKHYSKGWMRCVRCHSKKDLRISPRLKNQGAYWFRKNGYPDGYKILCFSCVKESRGRRLVKNKIWIDPETGKHAKDTRELVKCDWCGKKNLRKQCHIRKGKNQFCGKKCHAKWKSKNIRGKNHPRWNNTLITVHCTTCDVKLKRRVKFNKDGTRKYKRYFCTQECSGKWKSINLREDKIYNWKGGYEPYYGRTWNKRKRVAVRRRDNFTCQRCGITEKELGRRLDVHHIVPFRKFGIERHKEANVKSNLISYCTSCHKVVENAILVNERK